MAPAATVGYSHFRLVSARSATRAYDHFRPEMALGEDTFQSFRTNHFILYNMTIDNSCIENPWKLFDKWFQLFSFLRLFLSYCNTSSQTIVLDISVASQCRLPRYFLCSAGVCSSRRSCTLSFLLIGRPKPEWSVEDCAQAAWPRSLLACNHTIARRIERYHLHPHDTQCDGLRISASRKLTVLRKFFLCLGRLCRQVCPRARLASIRIVLQEISPMTIV